MEEAKEDDRKRRRFNIGGLFFLFLSEIAP